MKTRHIEYLAMILALAGCAQNELTPDPVEGGAGSDGRYLLSIGGEIASSIRTKADDNGFADGDEMGIYVVDYDGSTAGTLLAEDNRADNVRHTFDEDAWKWNSAYEIYFKDKKTPVDIYGYYPFSSSSPEDINSYPFELAKDQSTETTEAGLGGYESSDFLWGKAENIAPTSEVIKLSLGHIMAAVRVTLVEGTGFADGEWASTEKSVVISSTNRKSVIDMATGKATVSSETSEGSIIPVKTGVDYRAVVVPQEVAAGKDLMRVSVGGAPQSLKKSASFTYVAGKQHNFTLTVNKKASTGEYEVVLSGESITVWQPDEVSHDATAKAYVVVNVDVPGKLDSIITAQGKDLTQIRNLKLTGKINSRDFAVMRFKMTYLSALNLKEVEIVAGEGGSLGVTSYTDSGYEPNEALEIPNFAMNGKESLVTLILPDKLRKIGGSRGGGRGAFNGCVNLSGSLIIPEGVEVIEPAAFNGCTSLTGTLSLPSTLKQLGEKTCYTPYHDGVFAFCNFTCELRLPEGLKILGNGTFYSCKNLYGSIRLPEGLEFVGNGTFEFCENLSGDLSIPQGVADIPAECFNGCWLGGTLSLHDGIKTIGESAFANNGFKGELRLPKELEVISHSVFYNNDFSGELVLPEGLRTIGDKSFAYNWRLMGTLEIPENVISIGAGAFAQCRSLEGVIFPEGLESLRANTSYNEDGGAFQNCFGIGRIVCKGTIPAVVMDDVFHGVPKDNFTLEVPESAISQYQAADGWKDFKRIAAYRNFVCRPSSATAINTSVSRDIVLTSDGEWEVESQPDWVTLSQTSGNLKTELTLTFSEMPQGSETRKDSVIFLLKDKGYRTKCVVTQYNYEYAEDEIVTLQEATKGDGVNIVLLGDGYNAKDISEGDLMSDMKESMEYFFAVEPYKTYRDYFNVYTGIAVSAESGVGSVNTIIYNRFNTTAKGGVSLGWRNGESDFAEIMKYACKAPTVSSDNLSETLIIMIPNTSDYGGICYMYDDGSAIAYCPKSDYGYPLDWRGVIQHEAGGHGFGKLGDEYIYHNAFIDNCGCSCCGHVLEFNTAKSKGWFANMELTGKMNDVGWSDLIFDEKYSGVVDVFEGGYMHNRGVYRSEQNSCMNNDIPYYSTISRIAIVKRIKMIAGESYSFSDFKANDVMDAGTVTTKSIGWDGYTPTLPVHQHAPVFLGKRPNL